MGTDHDHESDEHYHGEPSRVLDDVPFPETMLLYPGTPEAGFFGDSAPVREDDVSYWHDIADSLNPFQKLVVPETINGTGSLVEASLQFDADDPGQFMTDPLREADSWLFVPARLRLEEDAWNDLAKNDVTVNWLTLDPDQPQGGTAAVVLSDWIVSLSDDVPRNRSAGITPGIFHLRQERLDNFLIALHEKASPWEAINSLLDQPEVKFRPNFIRNREWYFEPH